MGIKFKPEELTEIATSSSAVYENAKGMFVPIRKFVDTSGDNDAVESIKANATKIEKAFNDELLPAFLTFKTGITTYADNTEAFSKAFATMEPVSTASMSETEVKNTIAPVDMSN